MPDSPGTLFFDVGDSLIYLDPPLPTLYANIINETRGTDYTPATVQAVTQKLHDEIPKVNQGHFRYSDGWFEIYSHALLEVLSCPRPWDDIVARFFNLFDDPRTFKVFPDVAPCLQQIRERGFKTAIVSNWGYRLSDLLSRLGLMNGLFHVCISSAEVEWEKPDPEIFRLALEQTRSDPASTIHVGDNPEYDVDGAKACGIAGVLLDRNDSHPERNDKIASLEDLIPFLERNDMI